MIWNCSFLPSCWGGPGHPHLGNNGIYAEGNAPKPFRPVGHTKIGAHENSAGYGRANEKIENDFVLVMFPRGGQLTDRRVCSRCEDCLGQDEERINIERFEMPGPDDKARAEYDDDKGNKSVLRNNFPQKYGRKKHNEKS